MHKINSMENTLKISPALSGLPTIDYRSLNDFQGDFKTLSEVEYTKLKLNLFGDGVIPQNEFFVPLMVWIEPKSKKPYILDGHQRINVIKSLNGMPYELPYIEIAAKNKNEAKKKLALVNSQYGKITRDGWDSFMHDVDTDWVRGMTTLEAFTLPPLEGFNSTNDIKAAAASFDKDKDYSTFDDYDDNPMGAVGSHTLAIKCNNPNELRELYDRLAAEGYNCQVLNPK